MRQPTNDVGEKLLILYGDGMHLVRIELENFKSFGGQIIIPFEEGFTAITGPNGSGKSNCGDAIQFVLGPKSTRSLRASNVSELIFNGGGGGKAARNMSATLVFENTPESDGRRRLRIDTEEVSFTRSVRLNRKNDTISSYYINGNPSTATEMRRILAEAGLHGDGYNIVLQGDVTNLASMTPHKRRGVLEEVAGVTAYDDEIRRANNQRKVVENNIETIDLFEEEQKTRLKGLGKERQQALKFKDLKDELDLNKVVLQQSRHRNRLDEVRLLGEERSSYSEQITGLTENIRAGNHNLGDFDEELVQIGNDLDDIMSGDARELLDTIRQHEIDIETNSDRVGDQLKIIESTEEDIEIIREDYESAENARISGQDELDQAKESLLEADSDLIQAASDEKQAREAIQSGDRHGRDLNRALGQATDLVAEKHQEYSIARLESDRAEQTAQISSEKLADLEEEYEQATLTRDDLTLVGDEIQGSGGQVDRTALANELTRLTKQEIGLREDRDRSEVKARDTEVELAKARARQEAKANRPGSAITIAALTKLRQSGEIKGILGTLGELCSPKDVAHEDALALALGNGLRSIVVTNDEVAADCIKWLRLNGGGRATFLPLNKLNVSRPQGRTLIVARNPGILGFAHDLLDYELEVDIAVRYASRNTLIVQSMDVARKNMGGVRMVTLKGDIIEGSGAMTGGSPAGSSRPRFGGGSPGQLGSERLERAVEEANLIYSTVEAALRELRTNQQKLRDQIHGLDDSDQSVKIREWKSDLSRAQKDVDEIGKKIILARDEFSRVDKLFISSKEAAEKANQDHEESLQSRSDAAAALQNHTPDHLSEILRNAEKTRTDAERTKIVSDAAILNGNERMNILSNRLSELARQIKNKEQLISDARGAIFSLKESIANSQELLIDLKGQSSQFDEEQQILTQRREIIIEERASLRAALDSHSQKRETLASRIEELNIQIQQKRVAVNEIVAELADAEIDVPSAEIQLPTVAEAERVVQGLERRLGHLGDVNMLAIEQYDIAVERVAGLIEDGKILRQRRDDLVGIADRLESERKKRLLLVFEHVNRNFSRVYAQLQPGGIGSLRLENPKNPFDGGLEMDCVPPGKNSKTRRNLLSGGEKSMAALALIFAIQDYEPSPFYYFDEVDQNLDPFNSELIAALCLMRSQRAQFIMVTLRKVSLNLANHHIGITHAGDGCSRRITDFDRAAALQMSEEMEKEEAARKQSETERSELVLPDPEKMPRVPEPLGTPKSLGGLAERAGLDIDESEANEIDEESSKNGDLVALRERTEDWTEDIEEADKVQNALVDEENLQNDNVEVDSSEIEIE
ncbi:MAG: chromosome segregation protein SMC [Euryarchaeota archaeon]|nr:chromosome segregation protein SMC [Euryarchaeota archaeon]MBT3847295.1 chromosome segregation protein SMC [Euryarchaeota archaeon]MBT4156713.1 chromosome segregation protein SMC [Euryarchaeota archaeon]MBT4794027.1 chromosome segregation protein SMC [Euryarchaeota archaeon]MBT5639846.1 chromosome segregation protein SMC [Euryarchaeota archaeon]